MNATLLGALTLLLLAFSANLPLGYLRAGTRKYGFLWFLYIHLSIPLIVAARLLLGFGWGMVPATLACAVVGQLAGSRCRKPSA